MKKPRLLVLGLAVSLLACADPGVRAPSGARGSFAGGLTGGAGNGSGPGNQSRPAAAPAGPLSGSLGGPSGAKPGATSSGRIRGVVRDGGVTFALKQASGALPVAAAKVYLEGSPDIRTVSASDGSFELVDVPVGDHVVVAEKMTADQSLRVRTPISVKADAPLIDVASLMLRRTGSVVGIVTRADEESAAGTDVYLGGTTIIAKCNGRGAFALDTVAEGTYNLTASRPGFKPVTQQVQVRAGKVSNAEFRLEEQDLKAPSGTITGIQTLPNGDPAALVAVLLDGPLKLATLTGKDGSFTFTGLSEGDYQLAAFLEGFKAMRHKQEMKMDPNLSGPQVVDLGKVTMGASQGAATPVPLATLTPAPPASQSLPIGNLVGSTTASPTAAPFFPALPRPSSNPSPSPSPSLAPPAPPSLAPPYVPPSPLPIPAGLVDYPQADLTVQVDRPMVLRERLSPYKLKNTNLQIVKGGELYAEPGVVIEGNDFYAIRYAGPVRFYGSASKNIQVKDVNFEQLDMNVDELTIHHATITGGSLYDVGTKTGRYGLTVTHSKLTGVARMVAYFGHPSSQFKLTHNVFTGFKGIACSGTKNLTIRNNRFDNIVGGVLSLNFEVQGDITRNTFSRADFPAVELGGNVIRPFGVTLSENHWSTSNPDSLGRMVRDSNDDSGIQVNLVGPTGGINPVLSAPDAATP